MGGGIGGSVRSRGGLAVLFEAFFGGLWFAWSATAISDRYQWVAALAIAPFFVVTAWGGTRAWGPARDGTPIADPVFRRRSFALVGAEFVVALAAAWFTGGSSDQAVAWTTVVLGLHFLPLGWYLGQRRLRWAGAAVVVVGVTALVITLVSEAVSYPVAGGGTGLVLLAAGVVTLRRTGGGPPVSAGPVTS
ncbi:hypothetical protein [Cryptosporangium sp. NPDC051539]|uniref:hypothetical protein n=1 Tax=Cryptosporangium sp. NPDC051539 TaxID=3363962 RepID=UPI0037905763